VVVITGAPKSIPDVGEGESPTWSLGRNVRPDVGTEVGIAVGSNVGREVGPAVVTVVAGPGVSIPVGWDDNAGVGPGIG
jgi:hypothetical protein